MAKQNFGPVIISAGGFAFRGVPALGLNVINKTGSAIATDKLVAVTGFDVTSGRPKIVLADADLAAHYSVWVTTRAIPNGLEGTVYKGALSTANLNTNSATTVGDPVYLSGTAGGFAHTSDSTAGVVPVGFVKVKSATLGQIFWSIGLGNSMSVDQTIQATFNTAAGAAAGDYDGRFFIADRAYEVVAVREQHQTAGNDGGTVTVMVKKVPSGTAKASGTDILAAGINLKATADTIQSPALHATAANYQLAAGDSLGAVVTGTPTAVDGVSITVILKKI